MVHSLWSIFGDKNKAENKYSSNHERVKYHVDEMNNDVKVFLSPTSKFPGLEAVTQEPL
jgi:hypothetical protein